MLTPALAITINHLGSPAGAGGTTRASSPGRSGCAARITHQEIELNHQREGKNSNENEGQGNNLGAAAAAAAAVPNTLTGQAAASAAVAATCPAGEGHELAAKLLDARYLTLETRAHSARASGQHRCDSDCVGRAGASQRRQPRRASPYYLAVGSANRRRARPARESPAAEGGSSITYYLWSSGSEEAGMQQLLSVGGSHHLLTVCNVNQHSALDIFVYFSSNASDGPLDKGAH
jgi:hypothetical protein